MRKIIWNLKDLAVMQAVVTAVLFLSIPLLNLVGPGLNKWPAVLHGLGSTLTLIFGLQALHSIYPLLRGKKGSAEKLERILWMLNGLILLAIIFGNWLYIDYRAPDGLQQWELFHSPSMHLVAMEYKEFVALFALPMGVAAAFLLRRFRTSVHLEHSISGAVAVLVSLTWFCLLIGFVLGIAITKNNVT